MQLLGVPIGIIADDLTGACDTALQFYHRGAPSLVLTQTDWDVLSPQSTADVQVFSVNTQSRHASPDRAAKIVAQTATKLKDRFGIETFYKKMDSALRGHFAQECLSLLDTLGLDCALIVPAYPEELRRTVGGYQLLNGIPIEQTEVARDPQFPVRQSHIPTLLSQSVNPDLVGHIELLTVLRGAGPILSELNQLIQDGKRLVVVDACNDTDLDQITLVMDRMEKTAGILPCGSAGFAKALSRQWFETTKTETDSKTKVFPLVMETRPSFIVCSSTTVRTRKQIRMLEEHCEYFDKTGHQLTVVNLTPSQLLGTAPLTAVVEILQHALAASHTVILTTAYADDAVINTTQLAQELDISQAELHERVQRQLADVVLALSPDYPFHLTLCGGETTATLCRHLGFTSLKLAAEIEPAIPLLQVMNAAENAPRYMVSKSGNFGSYDALIHIVDFFKKHSR